jgi:hypothetical protein
MGPQQEFAGYESATEMVGHVVPIRPASVTLPPWPKSGGGEDHDDSTAPLKHLFAQDWVAIETPRYDREAREKFLAKLQQIAPGHRLDTSFSGKDAAGPDVRASGK